MGNLEYLKKLVSFETDGNEKGINECLSYIKNELELYGWNTELVKNNENGKNSLVASYNSNLKNISEGVLLAGHIDTVDTPKDKWETNPWEVTQKGNMLYGLGIADMKAFMGAILSNLQNIKKLDLKKPIVIAFTNDEETVMYSVQKVCEYFKNNNIKPKYSIIGEPSLMTFSNSNKGFYEFETIINGKACHSSNPQLGINAIYIMSKLITFIEELSFEYIKKGTTINVGLINGGKMCNIVADKCSIRWDVRTFKRQDLDDIKNRVNDYLNELMSKYNGADFTNEIVFKIPVFEYKNVDITNEFMKKYNIIEKPYDAATEAGFYQELGIDCIIYGCGDIKDAHTINEKIIIDNYNQYCENILDMIKYLCRN